VEGKRESKCEMFIFHNSGIWEMQTFEYHLSKDRDKDQYHLSKDSGIWVANLI
jgi:hypothetical protein